MYKRQATIWRRPDDDCWCRAEWPRDPASDAPVAPLDLSVGHTLELVPPGAGRTKYACVIAVKSDAVVACRAEDLAAVERASRLLSTRWRASQLQRASEQFFT